MKAFPIPLHQTRHTLVGAYDHTVSQNWLTHRNFQDACYTTWFIREGSVLLKAQGISLRATAGQWVFIDPFVQRTHLFARGSRILSVRVQIEWRRAPLIFAGSGLSIHSARQPRGLLQAGEGLVRAAQTPNDLPEDLVQQCRKESALYHWLAVWYPFMAANRTVQVENEKDEPRLRKILSILAQREGIGVIDYPAISKEVQLSRSQVDRLFRAALGLTPRQWCERRTLALAQQLLESSSLSIKEICFRLGFVDNSHFAKWYRSHTGQSPGEARRLIAETVPAGRSCPPC